MQDIIHGHCMYNFNNYYKISFSFATAVFSVANRGRILYEGLLNAIDSSNSTILSPDVTKLITDIVGAVLVGLPGILIKIFIGISLFIFISLNSGYCVVIDSILHHLCSDTVAHDWLSKVCSW